MTYKVVKHQGYIHELLTLREAQDGFDLGEHVFRLRISIVNAGTHVISVDELLGKPRGSTSGTTIYSRGGGSVYTNSEYELSDLEISDFPAYSHRKTIKEDVPIISTTSSFDSRKEKLHAIYILGQDLTFESWYTLITEFTGK